MIIKESDYLTHVGVLGMHWHHRKEPTPKESITIKTGTTLQRLTLTKNEKNNSRHAYVSQTKNDNNKYLVEWGNRGYKIDLQVTHDIIIPLHKERVDAFIESVSKSNINKVAKGIAGLKYKNDANKFLEEYENRNAKAVSEESYRSFSSSLVSSSYNRKIFFKELEKRGYNAIIDDNDSNWTDKPIIVFKRNKNIKQKSYTPINDKMIEEAIKNVKQ